MREKGKGVMRESSQQVGNPGRRKRRLVLVPQLRTAKGVCLLMGGREEKRTQKDPGTLGLRSKAYP